jgi:hypothetical protein
MLAAKDVEIGAANADPPDMHQYLVWLRLRPGAIDNRQLSRFFTNHCLHT